MSRYTDDQKLEIFKAYERSRSIVQTRMDLWRDHRIRPDKKTIKRVHQNLRFHHVLRGKPPGRPRSARTSENIQHIKRIAQERSDQGQPTSTRRLALEMQDQGKNISHVSVQRALRSDLHFKPYHERPIHKLKKLIDREELRWLVLSYE